MDAAYLTAIRLMMALIVAFVIAMMWQFATILRGSEADLEAAGNSPPQLVTFVIVLLIISDVFALVFLRSR